MALCHCKQEGKHSLRCIWYNKVQLDPFATLEQSIFCLWALIQPEKLCIPSERLSKAPWRRCSAHGLAKSLKQSPFYREAEADPGHGAQQGGYVAWRQIKNILWGEDCTRTRIWGCLKAWWSPWVQRWLWPRFQAEPGQFYPWTSPLSNPWVWLIPEAPAMQIARDNIQLSPGSPLELCKQHSGTKPSHQALLDSSSSATAESWQTMTKPSFLWCDGNMVRIKNCHKSLSFHSHHESFAPPQPGTAPKSESLLEEN